MGEQCAPLWLPGGDEAPEMRDGRAVRAAVHLPLMASASQPSLAAASPEIIPVSLMGHAAVTAGGR